MANEKWRVEFSKSKLFQFLTISTTDHVFITEYLKFILRFHKQVLWPSVTYFDKIIHLLEFRSNPTDHI